MTTPNPNLFVIGAMKCGTTSLAHVLSRNPDIFVPRRKEPHFFDDESHYRVGDAYLAAVYRKAARYKYRCDASPTYLTRWDAVIPRIQERASGDPTLKFIALLREPIARFRSHVTHNRSRLTETRGADEIARAELGQLARGADPGALTYLGPGLYGALLERWIDAFDRRRFLVLFSPELRGAIGPTCEKLRDFLGVASFPVEASPAKNVSGVPRSRAVARLLSGESGVRRLVRPYVPFGLRRWLARTAIQWNLKPGVDEPAHRLSEEVRAELATVYDEDQRRLEALLGMPCPWGEITA